LYNTAPLKKRKIINDPVYGFVSIPDGLVFSLIEHPWFQRLRYIKQLGMTHLVYPGALHTRFHHALGAMHLMCSAIEILRNKGHDIFQDEEEAVVVAILLHDIGHGPFSHALEQTIVDGISHEDISTLLMNKLNDEFNGGLTMAIEIFNGTYHKRFLHELVSGQLDMDRMDYLNRDSFFTGVSEGVISFDRIIKMLNIVNDHIAVEEKGIYSIEKFIIARRLMYWQVYLHKTVVAAEQLLAKILKRARELAFEKKPLFATPALNHFLADPVSKAEFMSNDVHIEAFTRLDDNDIMTSIKVWEKCDDFILSTLCRMLMQRKLYHVDITNDPPEAAFIENLNKRALRAYPIGEDQLDYFVFKDTIRNSAYKPGSDSIRILMKDGDLQDIAIASDNNNVGALSTTVKKYFVGYTKNLI
jgi:hypothetical protein